MDLSSKGKKVISILLLCVHVKYLLQESFKKSDRQANNGDLESSYSYTYITDDLIRKITNENDFSKITSLNFHIKLKGDAKIKVCIQIHLILRLSENRESLQARKFRRIEYKLQFDNTYGEFKSPQKA